MDELLGASANRCQSSRGVILVTPCQGLAVDRCFRCGIRLCLEHAMPAQGGILCPACAATGEPEVMPDSDATNDDDGHESLAPTATGDSMHDDELFTAADYDAFDSAGDADMNAGISDGFDS